LYFRLQTSDFRLHYFQGIPYPQRIKHCFQLMITIFAFANDVKAKIDLAIGKNEHEGDFEILELGNWEISFASPE
jgi:hypothetical protein